MLRQPVQTHCWLSMTTLVTCQQQLHPRMKTPQGGSQPVSPVHSSGCCMLTAATSSALMSKQRAQRRACTWTSS